MLEVNETAQMMELVNQNHSRVEAAKAARIARQERRVNWMMKAMRCAGGMFRTVR